MKDINFFSVYSRRKGNSLYRTFTIGLIFVVIILIVGGAYLALSLNYKSIKNKTAEIDAYMNSDEVATTLAAIERLMISDRMLRQYSQNLDEVLINLSSTDYISSVRMDEISMALPKNISMKEISVDDNVADFIFIVSDLSLTTQLVAALSDLDCFESVSVVDIDQSDSTDGSYNVSVSTFLKGGVTE